MLSVFAYPSRPPLDTLKAPMRSKLTTKSRRSKRTSVTASGGPFYGRSAEELASVRSATLTLVRSLIERHGGEVPHTHDFQVWTAEGARRLHPRLRVVRNGDRSVNALRSDGAATVRPRLPRSCRSRRF